MKMKILYYFSINIFLSIKRLEWKSVMNSLLLIKFVFIYLFVFHLIPYLRWVVFVGGWLSYIRTSI